VRAGVGPRRLVPTGPALVATDLLAGLSVRLSARRLAEAEELMAPVVGNTPAEADLTGVARRFVAARARGWELSWRPWELSRIPIRDVERLRDARGAGRGVIVSHTHLGPFAAWLPLVSELRPVLFPQGDWLTDDPEPGYNGYQVRHWRRIYSDAGATLVHNVGSAPLAHRVLRAGGAVLLTMDVPGDHPTTYLGKQVELDDGTARLAVRTGALVVPATLLPAGRRWEIHIGDPLDPGDFTGSDELHRELARVHEVPVLRYPEHLEPPARWLWGAVGRDAWRRRR
jgi:lauroyl/myristoyl acyltransferase